MATKKRKAPPADAIAVLKKDHEKVRGLLSQLERAASRNSEKAEQLLAQVDRELYYEAKEEHHVVDLVMPEVRKTDSDAEEFAAKTKVLKELIEHHADEEEKEMFPKARKLFDRAELRELGERLRERKKELGA